VLFSRLSLLSVFLSLAHALAALPHLYRLRLLDRFYLYRRAYSENLSAYLLVFPHHEHLHLHRHLDQDLSQALCHANLEVCLSPLLEHPHPQQSPDDVSLLLHFSLLEEETQLHRLPSTSHTLSLLGFSPLHATSLGYQPCFVV